MFVSASHQTGLDTRSFFYSGGVGRGKSDMSLGSSPAGHMLVIGSLSAMRARCVLLDLDLLNI